MQEQPFRAWLRDVQELRMDYIRNLVSQCRRVERHDGDLDSHWKSDGLKEVLDRLTYSREDERDGRPPRIPIDGDVYNATAMLKSAVGYYCDFLGALDDKRDGERGADGGAAPSPHAEAERWDRYLEDVRRYVENSDLKSNELDYKLRDQRRLQEARGAVLKGSESSLDIVRRSLNTNLSATFGRLSVGNWFRDHPHEALAALRAIWSTEELSTSDRIRAFADRLPLDVLSGTGTRLREISVLLMGLDGSRCPPFKVTEYMSAYDSTGHPGPAPDADEASLYEMRRASWTNSSNELGRQA